MNIYDYYAIIREPEFDMQTLEICSKYSRMRELDEAIDWALSRNPERFTKLHKDGFYIWKTQKILSDFPSLLIVYHINEVEHIVTLISIEER